MPPSEIVLAGAAVALALLLTPPLCALAGWLAAARLGAAQLAAAEERLAAVRASLADVLAREQRGAVAGAAVVATERALGSAPAGEPDRERLLRLARAGDPPPAAAGGAAGHRPG